MRQFNALPIADRTVVVYAEGPHDWPHLGPIVEELTGRPAEDFESIARRYLADPELILHGFSAGSKLGAVAGMIKMMLTPLPDLARWEARRGHPTLSAPK